MRFYGSNLTQILYFSNTLGDDRFSHENLLAVQVIHKDICETPDQKAKHKLNEKTASFTVLPAGKSDTLSRSGY